MIPRRIFQVWIGGEMPPREREWCAHWKGLNRRWEYRLFTDADMGAYANDPYINWMLSTGEKKAFIADRVRVLLLRDHGGIYIDTDCQPLRPLDTMARVWDADHVDFVCGFRSPDRKHVALHRGISLIDNTVLASAKGGRMIQRLCALYRPEAKVQNGYHMGMEIMRHSDETVVITNYRRFYAESPTPESILLHDAPGHNLGSWTEQRHEKFFQDFRNDEILHPASH